MSAHTGLHVDYARWQDAYWQWESIVSFVDGPLPWKAGVHSIGCGALPLDILIVNPERLADGQRVLPVFFSAAVGARTGRPGPFFSGAGLASSGHYAAICIADPSLALSSQLSLAWYAGSARQPTQACVEKLLSGLAKKLGVELLLIGGSGGGFAALQFGSRLGESASVLVWNPQTDLLRYYRNAVLRYLETCFPARSWTEPEALNVARDVLRKEAVQHEIVTAMVAGRLPRRLVYLQNAADTFHLENHAQALLERVLTVPTGKGCYGDVSERALALVCKWGEGHDPPPKPVLAEGIAKLIDRNCSAADVAAMFRNSLRTYATPGSGTLLRFSELPATPRISVEVDIRGGGIEAKASLPGLAPGSPLPVFAFYLMSGRERIHTRWYEEDPCVAFPLAEGEVPTHVVAFARDAFGEKIQTTQAVRTGALPTGKPAVRVVIIGSCVSRDAFAESVPGLCLVRYFARSSLSSALRPNPANPDVDLARIESVWQRRMVKYDLERRLVRDLREIQFDLVLLDLIDERFDVALVDGEPVTVSNEIVRAGFKPAAFQVLSQHDPARMRLWLEGVDLLMKLVGPGRVVVNKVYWATHDNQGAPLEGRAKIDLANSALRSMYDEIVKRYPVRVIDYSDELIISDVSHRWGGSPFHFISNMYEHTIRCLNKVAGDL